jgi:ubiquitin carboxyl-terminal hydrolase 5/13
LDEEEEKLIVPFQCCLNTFFGVEYLEYKNPGVGSLTLTQKTCRLKNFPRYLMIKLGRYYVGSNWVQVKIDARVPMPEELDLNMYRGYGLQSNEEIMPEETNENRGQTPVASGGSANEIDETVVLQLMG